MQHDNYRYSRIRQLRAEFARYGIHTITPREQVLVTWDDKPLGARMAKRGLMVDGLPAWRERIEEANVRSVAFHRGDVA